MSKAELKDLTIVTAVMSTLLVVGFVVAIIGIYNHLNQ